MQSGLGFAKRWGGPEFLPSTRGTLSGPGFSLNSAILEHSDETAGPVSQAATAHRCKGPAGGCERGQPTSCLLEERKGPRCFDSSLSSFCHPFGL